MHGLYCFFSKDLRNASAAQLDARMTVMPWHSRKCVSAPSFEAGIIDFGETVQVCVWNSEDEAIAFFGEIYEIFAAESLALPMKSAAAGLFHNRGMKAFFDADLMRSQICYDDSSFYKEGGHV